MISIIAEHQWSIGTSNTIFGLVKVKEEVMAFENIVLQNNCKETISVYIV